LRSTGFAVFTQRNETAHFGVERDFLAQAEGVGVVVLVRLELVAARVNRLVGRHGEAVEAGAAFRSDQVQGIVVGVPVTADVPGLLETVHVEAGVGHSLQGGKASGPGANDAIVIGHYDPHSLNVFGVQRTGKTTVVEEAKIKLRTLRQRAAERVVDSAPQRFKSRIAAHGMNPAKLHGVEFLSEKKHQRNRSPVGRGTIRASNTECRGAFALFMLGDEQDVSSTLYRNAYT
jgi:hypothetical protein